MLTAEFCILAQDLSDHSPSVSDNTDATQLEQTRVLGQTAVNTTGLISTWNS